MLTYGSEVWGIMADYCTIERVHLFAIKQFLNVSTRTQSTLVYGKTSKYPLYVNTFTRCIKYWLNLVRMADSHLPSKSYKMLYDLYCKNKNYWVSCVCLTLYLYGFRFIWENQGVGNMKRFLCKFRLITWLLSSRLVVPWFQRTILHSISKMPFSCRLFTIKKAVLRKHLVRFRLGVSPLKTHHLPYSERTPDIFTCPFVTPIWQ